MFKALIHKEFVLVRHPFMFISPLFGLMLLIPSYPYFMAVWYAFLCVFYMFISARENNDTMFTALLSVSKRDTVRARFVSVVVIELLQIAFCVPFAILNAHLKWNPGGNAVGIEPNIAFFGISFMICALFNIIFLPWHYKTAHNAGGPFAVGAVASALFFGIVEFLVHIPLLSGYLDTLDAAMQIKQLPVLACGMAVFAAVTYIAYRRAASNFEKADL